MSHEEIIEVYKNEFNSDPLFKKILSDKLETEIFSPHDYFESVSLTDTYPTKKALELLDLDPSDQVLMNYLSRKDLKDYFSILRKGRLYRYDWVILFKFKMILLLNTQKGYTPMDIASFVGMIADVSYSEPDSFRAGHSQQVNNMGLQEDQVYEIAEKVNDKSNQKILQSVLQGLNKATLSFQEKSIKDNIQHYQARLDELETYIAFTEATRIEAGDIQATGFLAGLFPRKITINEEKKNEVDKLITNLYKKKKDLEKEIAALIVEQEENATLLLDSKKTIEHIVEQEDGVTFTMLTTNQKEPIYHANKSTDDTN